jgi:hypothetical protein
VNTIFVKDTGLDLCMNKMKDVFIISIMKTHSEGKPEGCQHGQARKVGNEDNNISKEAK